jgi:hypothetical protein
VRVVHTLGVVFDNGGPVHDGVVRPDAEPEPEPAPSSAQHRGRGEREGEEVEER